MRGKKGSCWATNVNRTSTLWCVLPAWCSTEWVVPWFHSPDKARRLLLDAADGDGEWKIRIILIDPGLTNDVLSKRNYCYCLSEVVGDSHHLTQHRVPGCNSNIFTAPFARNLTQNDRNIELNVASCGGCRRSMKRNDILWGNFKWSGNEG